MIPTQIPREETGNLRGGGMYATERKSVGLPEYVFYFETEYL